MAKKKKRKHGIKPDLPIIIDYGGDLVSVYDPVSVMPYRNAKGLAAEYILP